MAIHDVCLQLPREFHQAGLDARFFIFVNGSICLFDKVAHDFESNTGKFL